MRRELEDLLAGRADAIRFGPERPLERVETRVLFPGSFDPLHRGHRRMAEVAAVRLGRPVEYEISVVNVDKRPLDPVVCQARLAQFGADTTVWLSRAATFVEKAQLFPGSTMIIGADTAIRVGASRYYPDRASRDRALATLAELRCRFLVFGRIVEGRFHTLETLDLPDDVAQLCDGVACEVFRSDLSSTELRSGKTDRRSPSP